MASRRAGASAARSGARTSGGPACRRTAPASSCAGSRRKAARCARKARWSSRPRRATAAPRSSFGFASSRGAGGWARRSLSCSASCRARWWTRRCTASRAWPRPARSLRPSASPPPAPIPAEEDFPMRALCWNGVNDLRVETVKDPEIVNPHDAILRVTMSTTCGSDLHFIDGYIPTMKPGDVIGHEFMGVVEEVGPEVGKVKKGDRVVVPSFIVCGQCWYCNHQLYSLCDNTHPKPELQEPILGYATIRTAEQHGQKYVPRLLDHAVKGELDASFLATHRFSLEDSPRGYAMFKHKEDGCVRSVFVP